MAWVISAVTVAITTLEAAAIATAVMEVGIAMSVVGTVTKSKELTKIGGVLTMAGGVASLAIGVTGMVGATVAGEAGVAEGATAGAYSDVAGEKFAQSAAGNAAGAVSSTGLEAAGSAMQTYGVPDLGSGIADTLGGKLPDTAMSPISSGFDAKPQALAGLGDAPALSPQAAAPQVSGTASAAPANNSSWLNPDISGNDMTARPLGGADPAIPKPSMFQNMKDWFKDLTPDAQSRIGAALVQGGGMAVGGIFNGWSEEQKLALAQQGQDLTKQKFNVANANANANYAPTVAFKPVAPKGLIAGAQGVK